MTTNHILKWKCTHSRYNQDCGKIYSDADPKLSWEVVNDTSVPFCECGHRVYLVVDTGDKYA